MLFATENKQKLINVSQPSHRILEQLKEEVNAARDWTEASWREFKAKTEQKWNKMEMKVNS